MPVLSQSNFFVENAPKPPKMKKYARMPIWNLAHRY